MTQNEAHNVTHGMPWPEKYVANRERPGIPVPTVLSEDEKELAWLVKENIAGMQRLKAKIFP